MKKRYLLALAVPLILAGCGGEEEGTEEGPKEPTFSVESLKEFGLTGTVSAEVDGETVASTHTVYASATEFYSEGIASAHYFKNADGKIAVKSVNSKNEVIEQEITDGDGNKYVFDETVVNPFLSLTEDKVAVSGKTVTLSIPSSDLTFADFLLFQTATVKSATITLDDEFKPLTFEMELNEFGASSKTYKNFVYSALFKSKAELGVPVYPFAAQGNTELDLFFEKMQAGNYELEIYSELVDEGRTPVQTAILTSTGILMRDSSYKNWGYVMDPNGGGLVEIEEIKGDSSFIKPTGSPDSTKTLATYVVPFTDFSTDLFTKNGNVYHLNNYMDVRRILPDATFSMNDQLMVKDSLDIELTSSGATYTYRANQLFGSTTYGIKVVVKNIGTTTFPYDLADPTQYVTTATCWADLTAGLDEWSLFEILGFNELDDFMPFFLPDGGYDVVEIWDGALSFKKDIASLADGYDLFDDFSWNCAQDILYYPGTLNPTNFSEANDSDSWNYYYHFVNGEDGIQIEVGIEEGWFGDSDKFYISISAYEAPADLYVSVSESFTGGTIDLASATVYDYDSYVEIAIESTTQGLVPATVYDENDVNTDMWIEATETGYNICFYMPNHDVKINAIFGYKLSKATNLENGKIADLNSDCGIGHAAGEHMKIKLTADSGYVPTSASIVDHPEVNVTITTAQSLFGTLSYFAEFDMPAYECTLTATFTASE